MKKIAIGSAIALTLLLVLSACGGSDNASDTSTNTTATDTYVTPSPEPAPVVTPEDTFLSQLNGLGDPVILATADSDLLDIGRSTCSALDRGNTVSELIMYLNDNGYLTSENSTAVGQIVGTAVVTLCPQYTQQLRDFINQNS